MNFNEEQFPGGLGGLSLPPGTKWETFAVKPTREWLISQLVLVELDLMALERLLTPSRTPHLRGELAEQVEGLLQAKERLLVELEEP